MSSDYETVKKAIAYISEEWNNQPQNTEIAEATGVPVHQLNRLFKDWAGLTPQSFLQAVTMDHAKRMLLDDVPLLDASFELGLSGPSRLHDLFITHESISPGIYKGRGRGLVVEYGWHPSPFGDALIMINERGLMGLAFAEADDHRAALEDMMGRWPNAEYRENSAATVAVARRVFAPDEWRADKPLRVVLIGTDFEIRVWEMLMQIPLGKLTSYSKLAEALDKPKAARAVGGAVGRNPISFVVPCHRVVGKSGAITGYHWGINRKRALLGWEAGISAAA